MVTVWQCLRTPPVLFVSKSICDEPNIMIVKFTIPMNLNVTFLVFFIYNNLCYACLNGNAGKPV